MPEFPIPCTNGQSAPSQGGSSISSFEPAASTLGLAGSIATVGSFCLFCGNGDGPLPVLTSASAANATAGSAPIASTLSMSANPPRFSIRIPPVGASPLPDPTPGIRAVNPSVGAIPMPPCMWAAWTNVLVRRASPAKGLARAPDEGGNDASALIADLSRRHRGAPRSGALRRRSTGTDPAEPDLPAERRGHQAAAHGSLSRQAL